MSRGSVGLGLATRRMSVATCQDRKIGKNVAFFLFLSVFILLVNCFASATVMSLKHRMIDKTVFISEMVSAPVYYIQDKIAALRVMVDVRRNNEMLAEENQRLLEWYQAANRLESENKALRDLLKMKDDAALTYHSGKVIADVETQYSHSILVRLGKKDGIAKGQGVLSHEGLIGRIIEIGDNTSRVLLLTDVNSRIPVTVEGGNDRAIMAGTNGNDPVLAHLPEGHSVITGQKVVTSGHGGIFPYGIPVGETYQLDNGFIAVRPFANPNRSSHVQVVEYGVPAGSAHRDIAGNATGVLR